MSITTIDDQQGYVSVVDDRGERRFPLGSAEAFAAVSKSWLRCGWDTKYVYTFTWLGRPIIQLPDDMFRIQEVIYRLKPDVIVETGIAHGGSLVYYASLLKLIGKGRVVGLDVEIRPHNRKAIESHELYPLITMIEGDSIDPKVVERVKIEVGKARTVLVILDAKHTRDHVRGELEAYGPLVSPSSYIVACDGIMMDVVGGPRTAPDWTWNNPKTAAEEFVRDHGDFILEEPAFPFNESLLSARVTYWPSAFVKRVK